MLESMMNDQTKLFYESRVDISETKITFCFVLFWCNLGMAIIKKKKSLYLVASGTISVVLLVAIFRLRMRYCVILVKRCLFLWTRNFGQYWRCSSICSIAWSYRLFNLQIKTSQKRSGVWTHALEPQEHDLWFCVTTILWWLPQKINFLWNRMSS